MIHIVVALNDRPGALRALLETLEKRVNLTYASTHSMENGVAEFNGFARLRSRSDSADSLKREIDQLPTVRSSEVFQSDDGLLVDKVHKGYRAADGDTFTLIRTSSLVKMFEDVVREFGSGGEVILYTEGLLLGTERAKSLRKILSSDPGVAFMQISQITTAMGFGEFSYSIESRDRITVTVKDCFEASVPTAFNRQCSFTRGLVAGTVGVILGVDMGCEETECRLKGGSVDKFVLTSRTEPSETPGPYAANRKSSSAQVARAPLIE